MNMATVIGKIKKVDEVMQYLPDLDDQSAKRLPRDYVFSIVNKVDGSFFRRAFHEVCGRRN